jgi:hypothetical protein
MMGGKNSLAMQIATNTAKCDSVHGEEEPC